MARAAAAEVREERARAAAAVDPDEYAAGLIARGVLPGQVSSLSQRLGDTLAEIEDEEAKIERAGKRAARVWRDYEAAKIGVAQMLRLQDADEGDPAKAEKLQRRADSLRRQMREASEAMTPRAAREQNAVEAAVSRSQAILAEVARMRAEDDAAAARARAQMASDRKKFYAGWGHRRRGS